MISGPDWTFTFPPTYALQGIQWRGDSPPRIHFRTPDGALVIYAPKPGSRRIPPAPLGQGGTSFSP